MNYATISLHPHFAVGAVDPRVFGGFLEHLGRAVYEGVYDPGSPRADKAGFRQDVLAALKRLRFTGMRYPGGNFVSGYDWKDGVGPREDRPRRRDLAWQTLETNQFGTDEFMAMAREMDWTPMVTVNLGTGTPAEAREWLEYCNGKPGTYWADKRAGNGVREPHNVKFWCLGNEMDGPWQLGHVPAKEYAIRAQQTARLMKLFDETIELTVCGSCTVDLPTYMHWDREILEYCAKDVDYIGVHRYVGNLDGDTEDFLAVGVSIDRQIEDIDAACRYAQGVTKAKKRVNLSFDEWNVWYRARDGAFSDGNGEEAPHLLEEVYNLEDALVVAQFLNSFIRRADVVKVANLAQIVNVIAPILTTKDGLVLQSIFYPVEMYSKRRQGVSLVADVSAPSANAKSHPGAKVIDATAILNRSELSVFIVNRSASAPAEIRIDLAGAALAKLLSGEIVTGTDPKAINEFGKEPNVVAEAFAEVCFQGGGALVSLPALSVAAVTLALA